MLSYNDISSVVIPENYKDIMIVISIIKENIIEVRSPRDDGIISTVKNLFYRWNGEVWYREIETINGTLTDRIAELCNQLLLKGYGVFFNFENNKEIIEKSMIGEYQKEIHNWILLQDEDLRIQWRGLNDQYYKKARAIKGSKWKDKAVIVPISNYKEVEDFAEINNFCFSDEAKQMIEKEKNFINEVIRAKINEKIEEKQISRLIDIVENGPVVVEELIDE